MIGLFILGIMAAWVVLAIILGILIPHWLNLKHKVIVRIFLVPVLILLPIMDEVIAYPQIRHMCKNIDGYKLMANKENIYGKTVYGEERKSKIQNIFPSTVEVFLHESGFFDYETNELILYARSIIVSRGWLGMPAGSSGTKMTIILKGCYAKPQIHGVSENYSFSRGPVLVEELDLKYISISERRPFNYPLSTNP